MKNTVENGRRFDAITEALQTRPDIVVVGSSVTERPDRKKNKTYLDTHISVIDESGTVNGLFEGIPTFPVTQEVYGHTIQTIRSFDTLGENSYRPIFVDVFPSVEVAEEIRERRES